MMNRRIYYLALSVVFSLTLLFGLTLYISSESIAAQSTIITVVTSDDELNSDGDCSLREAIVAANSDIAVDNCPAGSGVDTIVLPEGTFTLTVAGIGEDAAATGDLDITESVNINGTGQFSTTIDGNDLDRVIHVDPGQVGDIQLGVTDLTIRNGFETDGGGILVDGGGSLIVTNTTISDNLANNYGGGIHLFSSFTSLSVSNSSISSNYGGGIYNNGGDVSVHNADILSNTLNHGIWSTGGTLTIHDSLISKNTGGGISNSTGAMTITNSTISSNEGGNGVVNDGGPALILKSRIISNTANGVQNQMDGRLTIRDSLVAWNTFTSDGGGISISGALDTIIENSTISHNSATGDGGGIFHNAGPLTIRNSTISGNSADGSGGGLVLSSATASLNNVTITDNFANPDGGLIGGHGGGVVLLWDSTLTVQNSILAGNHDLSSTDFSPDCLSEPNGITSSGYTLVGAVDGCNWTAGPGDLTGTTGTLLDPKLGVLEDNGGETPTHALLDDSPAIDAASPNVPGSGGLACEGADQRYISRPQLNGCDMGAFELGELSIIMEDNPDPALINHPLTYLLTIKNTDAMTATSVVLTDTLPSSVNFSSASVGCSEVSQTVTCLLGDLDFNSETVVTITVTPTVAGPITNTATVLAYFDLEQETREVFESTIVVKDLEFLPIIIKVP
jgi:uncharacterized repeat protein (TIGR01451 family)/CSLREA domain-containing protein